MPLLPKPSNDQPQSPPDKSPTLWSKVSHLTPIALTVLATALAGLSSSEMTQSMYFRSLAGEYQAKAGEQWAYFQAKRIRGTNLEGTVALLRGLGHADPLDIGRMRAALAGAIHLLNPLSAGAAETGSAVQTKFDKWLADTKASGALKYLIGPDLPTTEDQKLPDTDDYRRLTAAVAALSQRRPEVELTGVVKAVVPASIEEATLVAQRNADAFTHACEPATSAVSRLRAIVAELSAAARPFLRPEDAESAVVNASSEVPDTAALRRRLDQLNSGIETTAMDLDSRRYARESAYNQSVAQLYELRVARSSVESDLHRNRSRHFFFSMLLAQAGVTIASLALARANHSLFWLLAVVAGLTSLILTGVTYFALG